MGGRDSTTSIKNLMTPIQDKALEMPDKMEASFKEVLSPNSESDMSNGPIQPLFDQNLSKEYLTPKSSKVINNKPNPSHSAEKSSSSNSEEPIPYILSSKW